MKNPDATPQPFLIVTSGRHHFALPVACVQEIVYPRSVTPLPFVAPCIDGLINIDGLIAVQVNLAALYQGAIPSEIAPPANGGELVLIQTGRAPCALWVERVIARSLLTPETEISSDTPVEPALLSGEALQADQRIFLLNPHSIGKLVYTSPLTTTDTNLLGKITASDEEETEMTIECVVIGIGEDRYALELQTITEIVEAGHYTTTPGAPQGLLGFQLLREQTLAVMNLSTLIHHQSTSATDLHWCVVVEHDQLRYGLYFNTLFGIEKFPFNTFHPIVDSNSAISGHFVHNNTSTLLLSPRALISTELGEYLAERSAQQQLQQDIVEDTTRFLKIQLRQKTYAIPVDRVRRITPFFPMETLSNNDEHICGAINIEGKIIPVLAIEQALQMTTQPHIDGEYVIVGDHAQEWAIRVDSAEQIIHIPTSHIRAISGQESHWFSGIAHLENQLVPLLDFSLPTQIPQTDSTSP